MGFSETEVFLAAMSYNIRTCNLISS